MESISENICRSCGHVTSESFCGNCGQKKYHRVDRKYLTDEIQYIFLHTNKGFFYTVKNLVKNPGKTAADYINGDRTKHYKPILLAFVLCGLSIFLSHYVFHLDDLVKKITDQSASPFFMEKFMNFFLKWYSVIMIAMLPVFSLASYLAFKGWGHNFYEHVIINAFFMSLYTIITIVFSGPLMYFFPDHYMLITTIFYIGTPFLLVWFYRGLYPQKDFISVFARVLIFTFLFVVGGMIISILVGIVGGFIYSQIASPEELKKLLPPTKRQ